MVCLFFFFKQKTAYEMRISDWSSDVCSSDLDKVGGGRRRGAALTLRLAPGLVRGAGHFGPGDAHALLAQILDQLALRGVDDRRGRLMLGVEPHRHALVAARHRDVEPAEVARHRSEEPTSELQSLMPNSY